MVIFDYDNVLLLPRQCRVDSRSECDTAVYPCIECLKFKIKCLQMTGTAT